MIRSTHGDVPRNQMPLLNRNRSRSGARIDHPYDDDGFWKFGYGNDPKRRRYIRRTERQQFGAQIGFMMAQAIDFDIPITITYKSYCGNCTKRFFAYDLDYLCPRCRKEVP